MEMLQKYNEGLVCTTACIANQVAQYFLKDEKILALNHLLELGKINKIIRHYKIIKKNFNNSNDNIIFLYYNRTTIYN